MSQTIKVLGCGGQVAENLSDAALLLPQLPSFADGHVFDQPGSADETANSFFVDVLWFGHPEGGLAGDRDAS